MSAGSTLKEGGRILAETAGYDHCFIKPFDTKVPLQLVASYCKKQLSPLGLRWRESRRAPTDLVQDIGQLCVLGRPASVHDFPERGGLQGGALASNPLRSS